MYCGKYLDEMSREELIEAINELAALNLEQNAEHGRTLEVWGQCQQARASRPKGLLSAIFG